MNRNYWKQLGLSFVIGLIVGEIYQTGINEGRRQVGNELMEFVKDVAEAGGTEK